MGAKLKQVGRIGVKIGGEVGVFIDPTALEIGTLLYVLKPETLAISEERKKAEHEVKLCNAEVASAGEAFSRARSKLYSANAALNYATIAELLPDEIRSLMKPLESLRYMGLGSSKISNRLSTAPLESMFTYSDRSFIEAIRAELQHTEAS